MIANLKTLLDKFFDPALADGARDDEKALQLATAALLVEVTRVDNQVTADEREAVLGAVAAKFSLDADASAALVRRAEERNREATSYFEFTAQINKNLDYAHKLELIEQMWEVAFADGEIDKYEDHLIRKVAGLLYVSHPDFIAAKHRVEAARAKT